MVPRNTTIRNKTTKTVETGAQYDHFSIFIYIAKKRQKLQREIVLQAAGRELRYPDLVGAKLSTINIINVTSLFPLNIESNLCLKIP